MSLLVFAMVSAVICLRFPSAHAATVPPIDLAPADADDTNAGDATDQVIVHLRSGAVRADAAAAVNAAGGSAEAVHTLASRRQRYVVKLDHVAGPAEMASLVADLNAQPDVLAAEPDRRMHTLAVPNDPYYSTYQWDLGAPSASAYGINAAAAWDTTTGSAGVRIAVVDTGYLNHADLAGRFVGGFDFVSDVATANDGNGRDLDAHDPGDWVTVAESVSGPLRNCSVETSSWHGSHVAGTIGAATNNSRGVAGINWVSPIVPVRASGLAVQKWYRLCAASSG
jgi:serine protease